MTHKDKLLKTQEQFQVWMLLEF